MTAAEAEREAALAARRAARKAKKRKRQRPVTLPMRRSAGPRCYFHGGIATAIAFIKSSSTGATSHCRPLTSSTLLSITRAYNARSARDRPEDRSSRRRSGERRRLLLVLRSRRLVTTAKKMSFHVSMCRGRTLCVPSETEPGVAHNLHPRAGIIDQCTSKSATNVPIAGGRKGRNIAPIVAVGIA